MLLGLVHPIISFLLQGVLHLLRFQMDLWLLGRASLILQIDIIEICRAGPIFRLLPQLELEEGIAIRPQVPDHVLLQEEVVRSRQMVVLVVLDRLQQTFSIEALLRFQVSNYLLVQQIKSLSYCVLFVVFYDPVGPGALYSRWTDVKAHRLRPVQLVPRVLTYLVDVYSLVRVSDEYASDHVPRLVREEVWRRVLRIQDLLVQVRGLLIFEWQVPAQHGVQDYSTAPQVAHEAIVLFASNHLYNK